MGALGYDACSIPIETSRLLSVSLFEFIGAKRVAKRVAAVQQCRREQRQGAYYEGGGGSVTDQPMGEAVLMSVAEWELPSKNFLARVLSGLWHILLDLSI